MTKIFLFLQILVPFRKIVSLNHVVPGKTWKKVLIFDEFFAELFQKV